MGDLERFEELRREYAHVVARLADPAVARDRRAFLALSRRHKELEPIERALEALAAARADRDAARELLEEAPPDSRDLVRAELAEAEARLSACEAELRQLLLPRDPNDGRNVIVTVRGAEGGEEANLFAKDLYEMYLRYAERNAWRVEPLEVQASDLGGIDEATFVVKGDTAWQRLKHEGGTHRVQRVPVTESQGRVHTSSAAVTVLPEADEVEVEIDPADLRIDVYRSTGPGGQSVNTTDSAVRITHLPTGLVVAMQDEKSQIQNRAKALQVLRARLLKLEQDRRAQELSSARRAQVGAGGRADKIRTYNFKENRVTDHRIGLTLYKLDRILDGELDELVDALLEDERRRQLAQADGSP
ncbi:MAG TPA: peptide chain release factor 1 [Acidimicrobiales bacterium]|nr:peptide chain release factor 1 [Acidimicrobiales bacterium]